MSLTPQGFRHSRKSGAIEHLHVPADRPAPIEYFPLLFIEAKIDFADVRSGLHHSCSVCNAMDLTQLEGDTLWTEDMVRAVDASQVRSGLPEGGQLSKLPEAVNSVFMSRCETQFMQYLMRHFSLRLMQNREAKLYSRPGESQDDFADRCFEALNEAFTRELNSLHSLFARRLEQIRERYHEQAGWNWMDRTAGATQFYDLMHKTSERISEAFLRSSLGMDKPAEVPPQTSHPQMELEEKLWLLETEANEAVVELWNDCRQKVRNIDEYVVHPNLKDIHLVRSCILWLP